RAPARASSLSEKVVAIEVHDFVPRSDEVTHELLLSVVARVKLCERAELRMCAEHEVGRRGGPLLFAGRAIATLVHILIRPRWSPRGADVEQIHEEVVRQRFGPV